jgi:WD40-like Beta Propeller Repeat
MRAPMEPRLTLLSLLLCSAAHAQQFASWSEPVNLGPVVNSAYNDQHATLSKDGLTLIFSSDRPGDADVGFGQGEFDLWVSQRSCTDTGDPSCEWSTPRNLGPTVNSAFRELAPNLSTDGHWLFFHSKRPGGCEGTAVPGADLYASHRRSKFDPFAWEPPIHLGCTLNTPADEAGPNLFEDDTTGLSYFYFTRCNTSVAPDYTPCTDAQQDRFDIYVSTCAADLDSCNREQLWTAAQLVPELSSPVRDTRTAIRRRDGLEMIVSTNRAGGIGSSDLWVSTRASTMDPWSPPEDLGFPADSNAFDGSPALSWDGQTLIFHSLRPGGSGNADLYVSTRAKGP